MEFAGPKEDGSLLIEEKMEIILYCFKGHVF